MTTGFGSHQTPDLYSTTETAGPLPCYEERTDWYIGGGGGGGRGSECSSVDVLDKAMEYCGAVW